MSENERSILIEELKALFSLHEEIIFAILYGSLANAQLAGKYGDMDIGGYLNFHSLHSPNYIWVSRLEAETYRVFLQRGLNFPPAEVLILNQAANHFLVKIFKGGFRHS